MQNQLFRQQSIDRISSPEQLHDYMRVTSPRLWFVLIAIAVLLVGFIIFSSTVNMENAMDVQAEVSRFQLDNGETMLMVDITLPVDKKDQVRIGMPVRLADLTGTIEYIFETGDGMEISVDLPDSAAASLKDGTYDAQIVLETTTPISFLLN